VLLEVLDEKPVRGHVAAVDDDAGVRRVARPPHAATVVGAPRPDVVEDRVVAVDDQRCRRLADRSTADPEEGVVEPWRFACVVVALPAVSVKAYPDGGVDRA